MFITLEGLDGAGTTTQLGLLAEALEQRGTTVRRTHEPSTGPIGVQIREVLAGRLLQNSGKRMSPGALALLFAADRLDHIEQVVAPALEAGEWVISDRYVHSSIAYQATENDVAWIVEINRQARAADLVIFVDVPVDVCLKRIDGRGERELFEQRETLERVAAEYEQAFQRRDDAVVRIDGEGTPAQVHARILSAVLAHP